MNSSLQNKGSSQASNWGQQRREAIERAKQLREERKLGTIRSQDNSADTYSYKSKPSTAISSNSYNQREDHQYQDSGYEKPPRGKSGGYFGEKTQAPEEVSQAQNSLRLLKSKMKPGTAYNSNEEEDFRNQYNYDRETYEEQNSYKYTEKSTANTSVNSSYRKAFKPTFNDEDAENINLNTQANKRNAAKPPSNQQRSYNPDNYFGEEGNTPSQTEKKPPLGGIKNKVASPTKDLYDRPTSSHKSQLSNEKPKSTISKTGAYPKKGSFNEMKDDDEEVIPNKARSNSSQKPSLQRKNSNSEVGLKKEETLPPLKKTAGASRGTPTNKRASDFDERSKYGSNEDKAPKSSQSQRSNFDDERPVKGTSTQKNFGAEEKSTRPPMNKAGAKPDPRGARNTKVEQEDERKNKTNLSGARGGSIIDEDRPINGSKTGSYNAFEEAPIKSSGAYNYNNYADDTPSKGYNPSNYDSDSRFPPKKTETKNTRALPPKSNAGPSSRNQYEDEDRPIKGAGSKGGYGSYEEERSFQSKKPNSFDEQPIKGSGYKNSYDEAPTKPAAKKGIQSNYSQKSNYEDDRSFKSGNKGYGSYEDERPAKASGNKGGFGSYEDDRSIKGAGNKGGYGSFEDDRPTKGAGKGYNAFEDDRPLNTGNKNQMNPYENDRPLKGGNNKMQQNYYEDSIPIAGSKKPNFQVQAPSMDDDEGELVDCPEGCGRRFNPDSIEKHAKICKKVFQTKRKAFDMAAQRKIEDMEKLESEKRQEAYSKPKQQQKAPAKRNNAMDDRQIAAEKKAKWKQESEAFRANLRQARGEKISVSEQAALSKMAQQQTDNLIPCNFCGRKFNEKAAQRHISFCENKTKLDQLKKGGKARK